MPQRCDDPYPAGTTRRSRRVAVDDTTDFDLTSKGLIASGAVVNGSDGPVWDTERFSFIEGDEPDTVNPSLWR